MHLLAADGQDRRQTVYWYWRTWVKTDLWENLNTALREQMRVSEGREAQPTACIMDSQSVKASEYAAEKGFDGAKKINGRKRFILTDTIGLVLKVHITPANLKETDGGRDLLERLEGQFPSLKHLWVDQGTHVSAGQGFQFWEFGCWVLGALKWSTQITGKSAARPGDKEFEVIPRRWVAERILAWVTRFRRLSRDVERLSKTVESLICACMTGLMLRRLVRSA